MKLATLCYLRQNGKTLMLHRIKKQNDIHEGKWNGLGGKFEPGETPEACARREIYEESGLKARRLELKGFITFPEFARLEDWYVFVFVVPEFEGDLKVSPEGVLRWIPDAELFNIPLWDGDRIFLPWLDRPGFFSARFTYKAGRLIDHTVEFYPPPPLATSGQTPSASPPAIASPTLAGAGLAVSPAPPAAATTPPNEATPSAAPPQFPGLGSASYVDW
ncbi:MAG: Mutator mutT protein (7,8-dihydro-8-oxoguanine-triphosphatase) [Candidatus Ozemobacter sibiricus]|jgi:8-oxo-dGTP diphosphatase|uniref:Mutator mutT protein (7,8-dihydro-8-oxoguanine-triphosphatase) n=1 Tax=Candidatus Ozemobacter sibiricus TaxID=2268124 RepID=A0A367ZRR2_9BACT|nr:MAG: Mutator mutT protein (7,8-dihydro-8-oxoguanine-triphosphatase) [Candidatus Ozemobacter sibiricus]